jgi:hypothetical protein
MEPEGDDGDDGEDCESGCDLSPFTVRCSGIGDSARP